MLPAIPSEQVLSEARMLLDAGAVSDAWSLLARNGDNYADNAAMVTKANPDGFVENFFSSLVKNHWKNTAGSDAYDRYSQQVAKDHLENYLDLLEDGDWPTSTEIADSYADALEKNGLPASAAFDGCVERSGFGNQWASMLGMEDERLGPESSRYSSVDKFTAAEALLKDSLDTFRDMSKVSELSDSDLSEGKKIMEDVLRTFAKAWIRHYFRPFLSVADAFTAARRYTQPRRDPLTLDLDNDGLETLGINAAAPILFDHDGTGIKTASGWIKPDDAFLVLDRNGNGLIDSGRELFGDATVKSNGQLARDGFDALADLDANADGQISTLDSTFARLKLWRDLNQDGVSQANELTSLGQAGIAAIHVVSSAHNQTLANGNEIADLGTFTRSDGSTGTAGEVTGRLADINLASNPFYRQFADTLDTAAVADLPDLRGSGAVRDLREAATLSPTLADSLRQLVAHAATGTRADFRNAVAALIDQWADSAQFSDSFARAAAAGQDLIFVPPGVSVLAAYNAHYGIIYAGSGGTLSDTPAHQQRIRDQQAQIERLLKTLETFNGLHFVAVPDNESTTSRPPSTLVAVSVPETGSGSGGRLTDAPAPLIYALEQDRLNLLQQSVQALRQSVQDGLALQTRLRPLLDTLALQIDAQGARLDFSALDAEFDRRLAADGQEGFGDLIDFNRATRSLLKDSGWTGWEKVADRLANDPQQDSFRSVLAEDGALVKGMAGFSGSGGIGNNLFIGDGGADGSYGNAGDDGLVGLAGKDTLGAGSGGEELFGWKSHDILCSHKGSAVFDHGVAVDRRPTGRRPRRQRAETIKEKNHIKSNGTNQNRGKTRAAPSNC